LPINRQKLPSDVVNIARGTLFALHGTAHENSQNKSIISMTYAFNLWHGTARHTPCNIYHCTGNNGTAHPATPDTILSLHA